MLTVKYTGDVGNLLGGTGQEWLPGQERDLPDDQAHALTDPPGKLFILVTAPPPVSSTPAPPPALQS